MKKRCTESSCRRIFTVTEGSAAVCPHCGKSYPRLSPSASVLKGYFFEFNHNTPIEFAKLSNRCAAALRKLNISTLEQLSQLTDGELLSCGNVGRDGLRELINLLGSHGLSLSVRVRLVSYNCRNVEVLRILRHSLAEIPTSLSLLRALNCTPVTFRIMKNKYSSFRESIARLDGVKIKAE